MSKITEKRNEEILGAPAEFWRALMVIRNAVLLIHEDEYHRHFFANSQREYQLPPIGSFRYAFDIVSDYLDQVELDGWLDD